MVEDESLVRQLTVRVLRQQGYTVWKAAHGEEALRVVAEHPGERVHLLLTDVVMPQMGGAEVAERLRVENPDLRVLMTSGYTDDSIIRQSMNMPGTAFLQKPFTPDILARKVREVLNAGTGR